jgi:hypothetical protein
MNDVPRWVTVPPEQWRRSDASIPIGFFGKIAATHELARDWRGTAFITFDDIEEEVAYQSPLVCAFLRHFYKELPHALYFLDPDPSCGAVLSWLCAQDGVLIFTVDDKPAIATTVDVLAVAERMFLNAAIFAVEMGDDWFAATEPHIRVFEKQLSAVIGRSSFDDSIISRLKDALMEQF